MKRIIILTTCFICLCAFMSGTVWAWKSSAYVHVKNKRNSYINADSVKVGSKSMSRQRKGVYYKKTSEGYRTFSAQKESEKKSKMSKVRPPYPKIVTIRFSRH